MRPYRECHREFLADLSTALEEAALGEGRVEAHLVLAPLRGSIPLVGAPAGIAVDTLIVVVDSDLNPWHHHRRHGAAIAQAIRQRLPALIPWRVEYRHGNRVAPLAEAGPNAQPRGWLDQNPSER